MAGHSGPGLGARLRRLAGRLPLRTQLVLVLVVLVAAGLAGSGLVATAALEQRLIDQLDERIRATAHQGPGPVAQVIPPNGPPQIISSMQSPLPSSFMTAVLDSAGQVSNVQQGQPNSGEPKLGSISGLAGREPSTVDSTVSGRQWRLMVNQVGDDQYFLVASTLDDIDSTVATLANILIAIGIVVLILLAGLGYWLVRASLRPLEVVEATAGAIAAGQLSRRVPVYQPHNEVGRLARALNTMLGRIEDALRARQSSELAARQSEERMRQFVADASHELRTPLTSIRGYAELYRQGAAADPAGAELAIRRVEEESARMSLLVEDLLLLARLDQQRPLRVELVDLAVLAVDAVHDARVLDPERSVLLQLGAAPGQDGEPAVPVYGDEARLRQVFTNLVGNALNHTPAGTAVEVRLSSQDRDGRSWATLEVVDFGPGLAPEVASRVFERFYRADAARTREQGGTGLGLAIVAALVAAHGGMVELHTAPGQGARFLVLLPAAAATSG